jgi:hypothetical protein
MEERALERCGRMFRLGEAATPRDGVHAAAFGLGEPRRKRDCLRCGAAAGRLSASRLAGLPPRRAGILERGQDPAETSSATQPGSIETAYLTG